VPGEDAFRVDGVIVEVLQPALYRVELKNGHRLIGHVSRRDRERLPSLATGDRVELELSPFDLSRGRVRGWRKRTEDESKGLS
jgi:translation initiation factor IF-1